MTASRSEELELEELFARPSAEAKLHEPSAGAKLRVDHGTRDSDVGSDELTETVYSVLVHREESEEQRDRRSPEERLTDDLAQYGAVGLISQMLSLAMDGLRAAADFYNLAVPRIASETQLCEIMTTAILAADGSVSTHESTTTSSRTMDSSRGSRDLECAFAKAFQKKIKLPTKCFDGNSQRLFEWLQYLKRYTELYPVDEDMFFAHVRLHCLEGDARNRVEFALSEIKSIPSLVAFLIDNFGGEEVLIRVRHKIVTGGVLQGTDLPMVYMTKLRTAVAKWNSQVSLLKKSTTGTCTSLSLTDLSPAEWIRALCRGMNEETRAEVGILAPDDTWEAHVSAFKGAEKVIRYKSRTSASGRGGGRVHATNNRYAAKHGAATAGIHALEVEKETERADDGRRLSHVGNDQGAGERGSVHVGGERHCDWRADKRMFCNVCDKPNPDSDHLDIHCPDNYHAKHGIDIGDGGCMRCGDGVRDEWNGEKHHTYECPQKWAGTGKRSEVWRQRQSSAPLLSSESAATSVKPTPAAVCEMKNEIKNEMEQLQRSMAVLQMDLDMVSCFEDEISGNPEMYNFEMEPENGDYNFVETKTTECDDWRAMTHYDSNACYYTPDSCCEGRGKGEEMW